MNPYYGINLTRNPFGELDITKRAKLAYVDNTLIEKLSDIFKHNNYILQILADHGRGKSTHLLRLHNYLSKQYSTPLPYIQLSDTQPLIWQPSPIYFVDNIESLGLLDRFKLFRKYPKLVVCTPKDLTLQMRLAGRQAYNVKVQQTDIQLLQKIFNARVEDAVLNHSGVIAYPSIQLVAILKEHCDNDVRAMESILYDIYYLLSKSKLLSKPKLLNRYKSQSRLLQPINNIHLTSHTTHPSPTFIKSAQATFDIANQIWTERGDTIIHWRHYNNN